MNEALQRTWPFLKPDRARFVLALALTPAVAGVGLVQPLLLKRALDLHIVAGAQDGLLMLALGYLGSVVLAFILEAFYTIALTTAAENSI